MPSSTGSPAPKPSGVGASGSTPGLGLLGVLVAVAVVIAWVARTLARRRQLAYELSEYHKLGSHDVRDPLAIGPYRVIRRLGSGGMAKVYLARSNKGGLVALKLPDPAFFRTDEHRSYFRQELSVGQKMQHENVVRILGYSDGGDGDIPFIAMEYVEGTTLDRKLVANQPCNLVESVTILSEVVAALEYAHSLGVIHRDIKPENIMLTREGQVKVADFGIARDLWERPRAHVEDDTFVGSPHYMSPEQINGEAVDYRTDYYSLGILAYRMLTGRLPFDGKSTIEVITRKVSETPPTPSTYNRDLPLELEALVRDLIQRDLSRRPVSALNIKKVLKKLIPPPDKRYRAKQRKKSPQGHDF
jgi:eukaryotic-like serine/threonine-protein kinase